MSCGSKQLSKDEAKSIINQCQEKSGKVIFKTNKYTYGIIDIPDSSSANFSNFLDKHKKMEELGFVSINDTKKDKREFGKSKNGMIEISLESKGKEYLAGRVENLFGKLSAQFKSCEYKISDIVEIQEIPDRNEAKVKVAFERYNEIPFFEESNEKSNPKEIIKTITFRKTTDGWKLCD
ncbi:hypothetical protein [Polaribacter butkevichii]|uniref:Uncharacterized protein n=1 Tax=Polaribacter butkevichii TaxID=218490 RepID=A0A2P6C956_9FLAO|nr:hypothetical protein [Polaribacter butkevichii]PQJ69476.1 hypothetical protein BTO14_15850 [Polaribacter butkevichii]